MAPRAKCSNIALRRHAALFLAILLALQWLTSYYILPFCFCFSFSSFACCGPDNFPSFTLLPRQRPRSILELENTTTTWSCLLELFTRRSATCHNPDSHHQCPVSYVIREERQAQPRGSRPFSYNTRIPPSSFSVSLSVSL